jgi:hypothetical protein
LKPVQCYSQRGRALSDDDGKQLTKDLKEIFRITFATKKKVGKILLLETYGPKIEQDVRLKIVDDSTLRRTLIEELLPNARTYHLDLALTLGPDWVCDVLRKKYHAEGKPFPSKYRVIKKETELAEHDKAQILGAFELGALKDFFNKIEKIPAFYWPPTDEIVVEKSAIQAGILAHEMAHAYAAENWRKFIFLMMFRNMRQVDKLDEGLTDYIAEKVYIKWANDHLKETIGPISSYGPEYRVYAREFIKAVGEMNALEAYLAGYVEWVGKIPEDTLRVGQGQKRKPWKWRWRKP